MSRKRNHPLMMVYELANLIKNSLFFFIFFFVVKAGSETWFFEYGRYVVIGLFFLTALYLPIKWYSRTYQLEATAVHMTHSWLTSTQKTVPYSKIQNVQKESKWFHRVSGMTSLTLETSMQGGESSIRFPVLKKEEAAWIEKSVQRKLSPASKQETVKSEEAEVPVLEEQMRNFEDDQIQRGYPKTVHFTPTKKEIVKASFASLSFLAFIPMIGSLLSKLDDFHFEKQVDGFLSFLFESPTVLVTASILFVVLSGVFGIGRTIVKYGKYEIASDEDMIFITKGMVEEKHISISKNKVQAILIEQSFMKRILGLAVVKFVCAGGSGEESEVSALYPFLPVKRAYSLVEELLPDYQFSSQMNRLPKQSFWIKMLKPSWLWMISTGLLYFVKPEPFGISSAWWILSVFLFIFIMISRALSFYHSSYAIHDQYIQLRSGGFTTSLFVSKRNKVIEMEASQTFIQKMLKLASINTVNQANPVRHTAMENVPADWAVSAYQWYTERKNEVHFVREGEANHEQVDVGVIGDGYR
ncbi:PH domain-containing protein [Halobacillus faecis]